MGVYGTEVFVSLAFVVAVFAPFAPFASLVSFEAESVFVLDVLAAPTAAYVFGMSKTFF